MIEFFMAMEPPTATAQERKVRFVAGRPQFYDPPAVEAARAKLHCRLAAHRPQKPFDKPVRMFVKWCFPMIGGASDGQPKGTRPDCDNLQKLLQDEMTKLRFWTDDALVAELSVGKYWASVTGVWIRLEEIR